MARPILYYTFGNHMHWVDMQWLWGYDVLPGSVDDMLRLIEATGARGNVNFDAIGYEKIAAECPEHLEKLRRAIAEGKVEPVGCSYGQPYGLFHGGESNIRQLSYGVRTTRRMLGVRPRAFWEEEFYFFPQLPQMLAQCGYTGACLFFQWTWHTPEIPKEPCSLILWEGIDGTRLPTLPRNDLNVHQWPEDFDGLLDKVQGNGHQASGIGERPDARGPGSSSDAQCLMPDAFPPAIVQWLELMPSKDWMCRSEVLLPRLKELMADPRFEIRPRTVSALISELLESSRAAEAAQSRPLQGAVPTPPSIPIRRYSMDEVWHGMTLGKNADRHPRASWVAEHHLQLAESISASVSLLGRPFPSWDLYPTWELDNAWQMCLAAQHHDNHECEGLCGFVGHQQFDAAIAAVTEVTARAFRLLSDRVGGVPIFNPVPWPRTIALPSGATALLPPLGHAVPGAATGQGPRTNILRRGSLYTLERGPFSVEIDADHGSIVQIRTKHRPGGILSPGQRIFGRTRRVGGVDPPFKVRGVETPTPDSLTILFEPEDPPSSSVEQDGALHLVHLRLAPDADAVDVEIGLDRTARLDPGFRGALRASVAIDGWRSVRSDSPLAALDVQRGSSGRRKYPSGDWMTSPQWFEELSGAFTSRSFVDLVREDGGGLLVLHTASQQWFKHEDRVEVILDAYDPWDEQRDQHDPMLLAGYRLLPHEGLRDSQRIAHAMEMRADTVNTISFDREARPLPARGGPVPVGGGTSDHPAVEPLFGPLSLENAPNVLAHAFFRESMKSGEHLPDWAGHRMARDSASACTHPFVIRLVEWDGQPAQVTLKLAGPVALAAKTNLLGEVLNDGPPRGGEPNPTGSAEPGWSPLDTGWLTVEPADPPDWAVVDGKPIELRGRRIEWSQVRFTMRPREIATIYADMMLGRKEFRDLDAKREVWATVHRTEPST